MNQNQKQVIIWKNKRISAVVGMIFFLWLSIWLGIRLYTGQSELEAGAILVFGFSAFFIIFCIVFCFIRNQKIVIDEQGIALYTQSGKLLQKNSWSEPYTKKVLTKTDLENTEAYLCFFFEDGNQYRIYWLNRDIRKIRQFVELDEEVQESRKREIRSAILVGTVVLALVIIWILIKVHPQ